ncbi:MAG: calcineurin-like phosphoesterase C-terminal domain-containing protein [Arenimonas sp.]
MRPANAIHWISLLVLTLAAGRAGALECTGRVVLDRDGDGLAGPRERGIAGVAVADGRTVTRTDRTGRYHFETQAGRTIQLIKPAGYTVPARVDGVPDTWSHVAPTTSPTLRYGGLHTTLPACRDFVLRRASPRQGPLEVLLFGDPQPKTSVDVGHFRRDIVEPLLAAGVDAQLGLTLGDVASDDLSLLEPVKAQTVRLGVPWLHVPGNHDLDFDATSDEDSLLSYRESFGGDTFAWEEAEAVFVGLDDVIWRPRSRDYIGGLREDQFEFLRAYLATLPRERERVLVLAAHIPFFDPRPGVETFRRVDRERLFALLAPFPHVLLVTAHGHVQRQYRHGPADGWHGTSPLPEFNAGATCGAYWSGRPDAAGIPDSTMADGTPNGYARLRITAGHEPVLSWHAARTAGDPRLALHAPRVLRRGAYPAFGVFANVWLGDADTKVELRVDDGAWKPMQKVDRADPALQAENAADDLAPLLRGFDRSPEAAASTHLWRGTLPTDLAAGEHRVEVRASGYWVGEAGAATTYRLDEVADP